MSLIQIISKQFGLNTKLFKNALEGITDDESAKQMNDNINHLRWITGHLVALRYRSSQRMGLTLEAYPHMDKFVVPNMPPPANRALDKSITYPPVAENMKYWDMYAEPMKQAIAKLTDEQCKVAGPFETPLGGNTLLDVQAFVVTHEAYHIGQISLIRKMLGHKAMSYM